MIVSMFGVCGINRKLETRLHVHVSVISCNDLYVYSMSQFRTLAKIPKFDLQLISDNNFFLAPHFVTKSESRTQLDDPVTRGKVCYAEGLLYNLGTDMVY